MDKNVTTANESVEELNDYMTVSTIPVMIFIGIISVFGTLGNASVLYVYSSKYPKCNFKHFVVFLAAVDCLSCGIVMPLEIVTFVYWFVFPAAWLCKFKSFFMAFTVCASAFLLLLIAIDRFKKVCKPHGDQIQPDLAIKLAFLALGLSTIPATSDAILWGHHTYYTSYNGEQVSVTICEKDDAYKDTILPKLHTIILYAGSNIIAMATTLILYAFIARKLFCVMRPEGHVPKIKVTTPDSSRDNRSPVILTETMFTFNSDTDQGMSDSEETDKNNKLQVEPTRQSSGSLVDSEPPSRESLDFNIDVPMRKSKSYETDTDNNRNSLDTHLNNSRPCRQRFSSCELLSGNENKLSEHKIAGVVYRSKSSPSQFLNRLNRRRRRSTVAGSLIGTTGARLRRKTLIMWILTIVFITTTVLYFGLIGHMSDSDDYITSLSVQERAAWLFFLRLYFINSIINPVLYGFLDPRFKRALWNMGVHMSWVAGSVKRNIGQSIRRTVSNSSHARNEVTVIRRSIIQRPESSSIV